MTYCSEIMWNIMFPCTLGRHSALTASLLWATVGAKYMSTCQTETSISGAVMLVYSREMRGESPGDLRENKHFSHSRFTKTHLRPLNTTREIFYHLFEAHVRKKKPTSECIWGDAESEGETNMMSESFFIAPTGKNPSQTLTSLKHLGFADSFP